MPGTRRRRKHRADDRTDPAETTGGTDPFGEGDDEARAVDATAWAEAVLEPNGGWNRDTSRDAYVLQDTLGAGTTVTRQPGRGRDNRGHDPDDTVEHRWVDGPDSTREQGLLDDLDVTADVGGFEAGSVPNLPGEPAYGPADEVGEVGGDGQSDGQGAGDASVDDRDVGLGDADRTRAERTRDEFLALHRRLVSSAWQVASEYFAGSPRIDDLAADAVDEALVRSIAHWERVRRQGNPIGSVALTTLDTCRTMVRKGRWFGDPPPLDPALEADDAQQPPPGPDDRSPAAAALDELRTREREVLVLSVWAGLSESEIALCLDISSSKVTDAALHGMAKLRTLIHGAEEAGDGAEEAGAESELEAEPGAEQPDAPADDSAGND